LSLKANANVRLGSTVQLIVEETDGDDEGLAVCVVGTLATKCDRPEVTVVADLAGAVQQGLQVLTSARGQQLRTEALRMLNTITRHSYAVCLAMQHMIETALTLVSKSFCVKKSLLLHSAVLTTMTEVIKGNEDLYGDDDI